ncbi:MAG: T9SS type A sorting domain-containing protein [Lewinellaceae bacterium]|nr:T9SS type A sorting domain-containing protein [Lewinellaceae bacterium]
MKNVFPLFLFMAFFFSSFSFQAQRIWSAEMFKEVVDQNVRVEVKIYRAGDSKLSIKFNWGDGNEEVLSLSGTQMHSSGFRRDTYLANHLYEEPGFYELSCIDSFLVENVVNIEDSGNKVLKLKDSLNVFPEGHPFARNEAPSFAGHPFGHNIQSDNGLINVIYSYHSEVFSGAEDYREEIAPFPAEGYSTPAHTNAFFMDENVMVWDRPVEPGIYAVCVKVREFRRGYNNPEDSVFMSTAHRAMMIDIDESMLVSAAPPFIDGILSIFPNPVSEVVYVHFDARFAPQADVQIYDMFGRKAYSGTLDGAGSGRRLAIPVAGWPPGMYVAEVRSGEQVSTRKFVVRTR